jgi:hypothetical protein
VDKPSEHNEDLSSKFEQYEHQPSGNVWDRIQGKLNDDNKTVAPLTAVFATYTHQPGAHVWDAIAAEIQPEKKKRAFYWWWVAAAGLALLAGIFFYQQTTNPNEQGTANALPIVPDADKKEPKNEETPAPELVIEEKISNGLDNNNMKQKIENKTNLSSNNNAIVHEKENSVIKRKRKNDYAPLNIHKNKMKEKVLPTILDLDYAAVIAASAVSHDTLNAVIAAVPVIPFDNDFQAGEAETSMQLAANFAPYYGAANGNTETSGPLADNATTTNYQTISVAESSQTSGNDGEYQLPIVMGTGVNFKLGKRWSIGTGANYVRMKSSVKYEQNSWETEQTNVKSYLGIPLYANFDVIQGKKFDLFVTVGGRYEKGLGEKVQITDSQNGEEVNAYQFRYQLSGGQAGANLGLGTNYHISKRFDAYLEAEVAHYFYQSHYNAWSENTFWPGLRVGVRYNFLEE